MRKISYFILLVFLTACSTSTVYYHKKSKDWESAVPTSKEAPLYTFYMIGDAGGDTDYSVPVLAGLEKNLQTADPEKSGVIFLGDNIYPHGLHKKSDTMRAQDEARLNAQLDIVKDYDGKIVFIPGNHDWDRQGEHGMKFIKRQEKYVQKYLDRGNVFRPSHGCPGPEVVKLAPGLVLILIDTQWWVHQFERPSGEKDGCDVRNPDELMVQFSDLLKKYRNQNIIVAGHHPLYSNGHHGGHFQAKDHLFPLTAKNKNAYIPMPGLGSIYPLYRKFLGHPQDIPHPVYTQMKNKLVAAMNEYENVVYVCGHEHNLQFTQQGSIHHVLSGSGSKVTYLKKDKNIAFGAMERGYTRLQYYANGDVWLEYLINPEGADPERVAYRKLLFNREVVRNEPVESVTKVSYTGKTATVVPDSNYEAGGLKRVFFGDLNRDLWTTPLEVPYLDIHHEAGGLTPIKRGGGMQTISLRMQGADGKQYTLRGIKKNSVYLVGRNLRNTIAQDVVYDGIAGSHPYASVTIPTLSDAVGVYHSNPRLVYVPKDPVLGDFMEEFGGMLCLFEERPDDDMSDMACFGNSDEVVNYRDAIENMHEKHDHVVDMDYVLTARLFDMVIGDWDRHDDQWRWATLEKDGKTLYRPIPRDRDQAFFRFDGVFMSISNRKFLLRKFQPFREEIRDIEGQNFNARYFDRSYLTEASREDWVRQAALLKQNLTDEVIEKAIRELPPEGFAVTGEEIIKVLKVRRDKVVEFAERYYDVLAKEVDVVGTLKKDYFQVMRNADGSVEVNVYPIKKGKIKKKKRYYHRVFYREETKEVVLYGLGGHDQYDISGKADKSLVVRVVAGFKKDVVTDSSEVKGIRKMTKVYDTEGKNEYYLQKETRLKVYEDTDGLDYDRKSFVYDRLAPLLSVGYNPNDGFYIGPGGVLVTQGFKKSPYRNLQYFMANRAFGSDGYNAKYMFDFVDAVKTADFTGRIELRNPLVFQFYGEGNETKAETDDFSFYNIRMNDFQVAPGFKFTSKSLSQRVKIGVDYRFVSFEGTPVAPIEAQELEEQQFLGASINYAFINQDDRLHPARGVQLRASAGWNQSLSSDVANFVNLSSELRLYLPLYITNKQTTLALRTGVATNFGDYAFYQSNFLHGFQNFRGVQRNRFAGRTSFYQNVDLRFSLFKVPNYIVPFDVGLMAHGDLGRVWVDGESSDEWHESVGGGVFINILEALMLTGTYSVSDTDEVLLIGSRFLF